MYRRQFHEEIIKGVPVGTARLYDEYYFGVLIRYHNPTVDTPGSLGLLGNHLF